MRFLCVNILTGITHTSVQDVVHIRWCSSRLPVIRPVSPVEQEQLTLPEHLRLILVFVEFMLLKHSFLCGILQIIVCFFLFFIFLVFYYLYFFDLRLVTIPVTSPHVSYLVYHMFYTNTNTHPCQILFNIINRMLLDIRFVLDLIFRG